VLEGLLEEARQQCARRKIELELALSIPPGQQMRGDRLLLSQAFRAVLDHSVRFSGRGTRVCASFAVGEDGDLLARVQDTAANLTQAHIDEILGRTEAVSPVSAENVEPYSALKLARVLIEAHQGGLSMNIVAREGVTTELRLPRARLKATQAAGEADPSAATLRLDQVARALSARPANPPLFRSAGTGPARPR
jgi:signal transduction histidine kinase